MYDKVVKRVFSFCGSLAAIILLSPLLIVVSVLILVNLGAPVLFVQERVGRNEKPFKMYKFRSMSNKTDENGELLPDYLRLTKFGQFLRSSSIDELPALFNILKGNMSFIGPRPMPVIYLPYFTDRERLRHSVRGGLSGWAQVHGRNTLMWDEKFEYDVYYAENISFVLDVKIFFKSVVKVFKHDDIGVRGVDAPPDFNIYRAEMQKEKEQELVTK